MVRGTGPNNLLATMSMPTSNYRISISRASIENKSFTVDNQNSVRLLGLDFWIGKSLGKLLFDAATNGPNVEGHF